MTKVLIVIGASNAHQAGRKAGVGELAEADIVIGLNEECSEGTILKDRHGNREMPVKIVA